MLVTFNTKLQVKWAYDSLHLYRTLRYTEFKHSMEFPRFLELSGEQQDARCKAHNVLIYRMREWLDELKDNRALSVRDGEAVLMLKILSYRPHHFFPPEQVIADQLHLLGRITASPPPR